MVYDLQRTQLQTCRLQFPTHSPCRGLRDRCRTEVRCSIGGIDTNDREKRKDNVEKHVHTFMLDIECCVFVPSERLHSLTVAIRRLRSKSPTMSVIGMLRQPTRLFRRCPARLAPRCRFRKSYAAVSSGGGQQLF